MAQLMMMMIDDEGNEEDEGNDDDEADDDNNNNNNVKRMDGHCHITGVVRMLGIKKSINVEGKRRWCEEDGWTCPPPYQNKKSPPDAKGGPKKSPPDAGRTRDIGLKRPTLYQLS